jgi:hypothetical protein
VAENRDIVMRWAESGTNRYPPARRDLDEVAKKVTEQLARKTKARRKNG